MPHGVEKHTFRGCSDLEVRAGSFYWVVEFKYARDEDDDGGEAPHADYIRDGFLLEALEQMEIKEYGPLVGFKRIRMGLVFSQQARRLVRWDDLP